MKKRLITLLVCGLFASMSFGQTQFGVGAAYYNDFGVQARAKLGVGEKLNVVPSFTYWFADFGTRFNIDGNVNYNITSVADGVSIYATGGLGLWFLSGDGIESSSDLALNLGAGSQVTNNIYVELRWLNFLCENCGNDIGFQVGYYF